MYAVVSPSPPSLYPKCYKRGLSRKAINYILQQYDTCFNICTCCFNIWGGGRWSILLTIAFCDGGRGSSSFLGFVMSFPFLQHIYKSTGENTNLTKQAGTAERNFKLGGRGKVKTSKSIEGEGTPRRWSNWPVKLVLSDFPEVHGCKRETLCILAGKQLGRRRHCYFLVTSLNAVVSDKTRTD